MLLGTRLFLYFSHLPWHKCGNVPMKFAEVDRVECGTGPAGWPKSGCWLEGSAMVMHLGTHNYCFS